MDIELDGGRVVVPGVEVDVCAGCGEQLFDLEAMRKIEAADPPQRRRRRKARL